MAGAESEPGSARLFVALALPAPVAAELAAWTTGIAAKLAIRTAGIAAERRLRPLAAEGLHVTLCFLGSRPLCERAGIERALADAVQGCPAPLCAAGELTWLPGRSPRALALMLRDADGSLAFLQAAVSRALVRAAAHRPQRRRFSAHVTLARVRAGARIDTRAPLPPAPAVSPWTGELVCLFCSLPGPGASRYERLVTLRLHAAQSGP